MLIINKKILIFNAREVYFSYNLLKIENFLYNLKIIINKCMNQIYVYSSFGNGDFK